MTRSTTKLLFLGLIFIFVTISCGNDVKALSIPSEIPELEQQISIDISSEFPKPLEKVRITITAYGTNLNLANITWRVDGATAQTGKGITSFEVQSGKAGQTKKIELTIEPVDGGLIKKLITLSPQDVDLIWESHTYTPPFYKGKAMFSPQEEVTFVAIPHFVNSNGSPIARSSLVYNWKKDYIAIADQSGYGKNVFKTKGSILLKPISAIVEVTSAGNERSKKDLLLSPTQPLVLIYEDNPLYGILYNNAIYGTHNFKEAVEKTFSASPYFFGVTLKNDTLLNYEWNIVGAKIDLPKNQNNVTFRNTNEKSGKSSIGVKISNSLNIFQESSQNVLLDFSAPQQSFNL